MGGSSRCAWRKPGARPACRQPQSIHGSTPPRPTHASCPPSKHGEARQRRKLALNVRQRRSLANLVPVLLDGVHHRLPQVGIDIRWRLVGKGLNAGSPVVCGRWRAHKARRTRGGVRDRTRRREARRSAPCPAHTANPALCAERLCERSKQHSGGKGARRPPASAAQLATGAH